MSPTPPPGFAISGFVADTARLGDPASATAALRPLVAWLTGAPAGRVVLTGTTARSGDRPGQIELSLQRAQTVADLLIAAGVPADRITTHGVGSYWPGYHPDHDADGGLLPIIAEANRTVLVEPVA